ncbi:MAG: hypothetical protein GTN81_03155 [Proteobacteria bacterium]|nr:hypothetical protein [Pseudomonadota bacterium]
MDVLNLEAEVLAREWQKKDEFLQEKYLLSILCDIERPRLRISITGILIGTGLGVLLWVAIIYGVLALI